MQYINLFLPTRNRLGLSNNQIVLLTNLNNICESQQVEWFSGYPSLGKVAFLQVLAGFVSTNFTANGVFGLCENLAKKGLIELDYENMKIRITDVFKTSLQKDKQAVNTKKFENMQDEKPNERPLSKTAVKKAKAENEQLTKAFNEVTLTNSENLEAYKEQLEIFEKIATREEKLTEEQKNFLKGLAAMLRPTEDRVTISEKALQSLYEKNYGRRVEAIEKFEIFRNWEIDSEMTEKEYFNKLNSTVIWLSIAKKHDLGFLEKDENRLRKAIEFVGISKNDNTANYKAALEHFRSRKAFLIEKEKKETFEVDPSVKTELEKVLKPAT